MDIGYPHTRPCDRVGSLPPELSIVAARMASFLGAGGQAIVLTGAPGSGKTALMERVLSGLSGLVTRVRAEPGAATLGVAALLRQMNEPPPDDGDETALFLRTIAVAAYDEYSAVLAIDDAHTLSAEALQVLARVPGLGGATTPGMTLILAGEPSLLEHLAAPGLEVFGNARRTLIARTPTAVQAAVHVDSPMRLAAHGRVIGTEPAQTPHAGGWLIRHRRDLGLVGGALLAGAALATGALTWLGRAELPPTEVAARPAIQAPLIAAVAPLLPAPLLPGPLLPGPLVPVPLPTALVEPPAPALAVPAMVPIVPPPVLAAVVPEPPAPAVAATPPASVAVTGPAPRPQLSQAQLRQEFDGFLNRAGPDTARLTPAARAALWREFVQWRAGKP